MDIRAINVQLIDPPLFNSREPSSEGYKEDSLRTLGESLRTNQQSPIRVIAVNGGGRFRLIYGSRRVAAAKLVNLETLNAEVVGDKGDAAEILANGIENCQRNDLSTYEIARLCAKLRELKLSGKEVAAQLGISFQYASNLAICYEKLPVVVKDGWKQGVEGTDVTFLRSIITKEVDGKKVDRSADEMVALYNERRQALAQIEGEPEEDEDDDEDDDDGETAGAPPPSKYTVQKERYRALMKALRATKAPTMAIDACRYLVGEIEKIRGVAIGDATAPTKKVDKKGKE